MATKHILFTNATIITFNPSTSALEVLKNYSLLTTNSVITAIAPNVPAPTQDANTSVETIDSTNKILSPGFINTHSHIWQTALRTLGPDTTLCEYFGRFSQYSPIATGGAFDEDGVEVSALMGYLEGLNAGVTGFVEHAHANWSVSVMKASYEAAVECGARIWWCCSPDEREGVDSGEMRALMENIRDRNDGDEDALVRLGYAWDGFQTAAADEEELKKHKTFIEDLKVEALTLHHLGGPWPLGNNAPSLAHRAPASLQNLNIPIIFSHGPFVTSDDIAALRSANWNLSVTPESEMHYGHGQKTSHKVLDQASLGTDTPFTFSGDMLTQSRLFLQHVRANAFQEVLDAGKVPTLSPMSVDDAFLLMTRQGGQALRRDDLGVLRVGAKADVVVFDTNNPGLVGCSDPVAAVVLHANVGNIEGVIVDGVWRKKEGKLVEVDWEWLKERFVKVARRMQEGMEKLDKEATAQEESKGPFGGMMKFGVPEVSSTKKPGGSA